MSENTLDKTQLLHSIQAKKYQKESGEFEMIYYLATEESKISSKSLFEILIDQFSYYFGKELDAQLNNLNCTYLLNKLKEIDVKDREKFWIPFYLAVKTMKDFSATWRKNNRPSEWVRDIISNGIFFYSHDDLLSSFKPPAGTFALRICWRCKPNNKRTYELEAPLCLTLWHNENMQDRLQMNLIEIEKGDFLLKKEMQYMLFMHGTTIVYKVEDILKYGNYYFLPTDPHKKQYKELSSLTPIPVTIIHRR